MKKRLFAIMLALVMLLAAVPALAEEGEVQEQDQVKEKILCATEGCKNEVANKGDFCKDCATAKKVAEEAAKKAAEEEAARKAAEEEAAKKVAEEAAKKAAEEEAARKAAEEAAKKAAEKEAAKESPINLAEANPAGAETANGCNHEHTTGWGGTMVEHPAKDPTCTSEGNIKYYTCTNCGRYFLRNETITDKIEADEISAEKVKISKKDHTPTQIAAKAATCTEAGNIEYYECSACKGKFADSTGTQSVENIVIPALGHSVPADGEYTVKPTCTTPGKATYRCSKCNTELKDI